MTGSSFDAFWQAYPRKVGKGLAERLWSRLKVKDDLLKIILTKIDEQKQSHQWKRENGRFIPYPSTWLAQKRWEDEPDNYGATARVRNLPSAAEVRRVLRDHRDRMVGCRDPDAAWERIFRSELACSYQDAMKVLQ